MTVNVNRNLNSPIFTDPDEDEEFSAVVDILETENFNTAIYELEARDADRSVSRAKVDDLLVLAELLLCIDF